MPGVARVSVVEADRTSRRLTRASPHLTRRLVAPAASRAYILSVSASPPKFVRPCIPTTAKAIPRGDDWLHEPKLDGYRFQIVKDGRQVRLYSRNATDWTRRLPMLAQALQGLPCRSAVLDGELFLPDRSGAPDFRGLQAAMRSRPDDVAVFVFDLLYRNGNDLRPLPLYERRRRLIGLVSRAELPCLHLVRAFEDGARLFKAAERHGLEGIVSKRRDAPYLSGPSKAWVKVKTAAWREANRERWRMFERPER